MALASPLIRATRRAVCPICGHPDYCSFAPDGTVALCYRDVPAPLGWKIIKTGLSATGQFRVCVPDCPRFVSHSSSRPAVARPEAPACAPLAIRHAVYRAWWDVLTLSRTHAQALSQRGLPREALQAYRSWPADHRNQQRVLAALWDQFGDTLWTIPGFYRHASSVTPRCTALPGLLIPVFDAAGTIQAVKCRPDTPWRGLKYYWLSSGSHGGPSSGSPVGFPPAFAQASFAVDLVRITEGELKAHVAQTLSGIRTISAPGVGGGLAAFHALQAWWDRAKIPVARRQLIVAFDQDVPPNPHVEQARRQLVQAAQQAGIATGLEQWEATAGKGIDDVLRDAPAALRRVLCEDARRPRSG